jgi:hypothetical protein
VQELARPPCVSRVSSTTFVIAESGSFVMPTVQSAPLARASESTRLMSSPSPDCETPMTTAWSSLSFAL